MHLFTTYTMNDKTVLTDQQWLWSVNQYHLNKMILYVHFNFQTENKNFCEQKLQTIIMFVTDTQKNFCTDFMVIWYPLHNFNGQVVTVSSVWAC